MSAIPLGTLNDRSSPGAFTDILPSSALPSAEAATALPVSASPRPIFASHAPSARAPNRAIVLTKVIAVSSFRSRPS